jgi:hypothetical protein
MGRPAVWQRICGAPGGMVSLQQKTYGPGNQPDPKFYICTTQPDLLLWLRPQLLNELPNDRSYGRDGLRDGTKVLCGMLNFVLIGLIFADCAFQLLRGLECFLVLLLLFLRYDCGLRADMLDNSVYFLSHSRLMD